MTDDSTEPWRGRDGEFSPTYYAHKGPDATSEALADLLAARLGRDASVLEVGCNVGRHLAHLHDEGFADLTGLDINAEAIAELRETYPDLAAAGEFLVADLVATFADLGAGAFDVVYSVETLQHVAPADASVFDDVARVAGSLLVTVENETPMDGSGDDVTRVNDTIPLYHRDWREVFAGRGLEQVAVGDMGRDTLRAFRVPRLDEE
ncbi:class I SAM-dependent methyltransferase [Halosegnis marinus]|uniref:Class I SAM-dependent methyltransferase n=1 Tax=Halosegnis marinus TaxID=3034023 RepID=A0ABD5ZR66_9EURY|nr:class I SAM-dependent methyltransferase [Halosegnis sp. DT85]